MKIKIFIGFFQGEKSMPALAQRAGSKNQLIYYDFGQKTREELAPGVRIYMCIHAYLHYCVFSCLHSCIFAYLHSCIFAYMHTYNIAQIVMIIHNKKIYHLHKIIQIFENVSVLS